MKVLSLTIILIVFFMAICALAQSPDSFIVESVNATPGDTIAISVYMRNTQFSVAGFAMRIVLLDSAYASFDTVLRGSAVQDFDYFQPVIYEGTCRIYGIADLPGGNSPPLLAIGYHEMARVSVIISEFAPIGESDSVLFMDDSLPPDRDNSISDSTGYINEVPSLIGGVILFETQSGIDEDPVELPSRVDLKQNYPNPFNARTRISFTLAQEEKNVKLDVYDIMGRQITSFFWNHLFAGEHYVVWDARNENGELLTSGVYFYGLALSGVFADNKRMTLLK